MTQDLVPIGGGGSRRAMARGQQSVLADAPDDLALLVRPARTVEEAARHAGI